MKFLYVLTPDHRVVPASTEVWAMTFEDMKKRRVAQTFSSRYRISTVFIGIEDQLFETMAFDGDAGEVDCERSSSWNDALAAHNAMVTKWQRKEATHG